jgi:hypothetical protein
VVDDDYGSPNLRLHLSHASRVIPLGVYTHSTSGRSLLTSMMFQFSLSKKAISLKATPDALCSRRRCPVLLPPPISTKFGSEAKHDARVDPSSTTKCWRQIRAQCGSSVRLATAARMSCPRALNLLMSARAYELPRKG